MSEDSLIRYDNLDAIVRARQWGPKELSNATGRKPNQCSDMLRRKKSFGEDIARDFERKLGLPRGWFDEPHDQSDPWLKNNNTTIATPAEPQQFHVAKEASVEYGAWGNSQHATLKDSARTWLRAPVVAWARLGVDLYRANYEWPEGELIGFPATKPPAGGRYKLVPVLDDSLAPRIVTSDLVVIDPDNTNAERNQVVLVKGPDDVYLLRRYIPLAGGTFEVCDSSGRTLDSMRHGLAVIGVAIGLVPHDL